MEDLQSFLGGLSMLNLTRRVGEKIFIGDNIQIIVVAIDRGRVRLGIQAPQEVPVHRKEVWDEIHKNDNKQVKSA